MVYNALGARCRTAKPSCKCKNSCSLCRLQLQTIEEKNWDDLREQILTPEVKHPLKASQICATPTSYGLLFLPAKRLNLFLEPVARLSGFYTSERAASGY